VKATSVNPVDTKIRQGRHVPIAPEFPAILHGDLAGVVEAVGQGVTDFRPGDEVYGCAGGLKGFGGAAAEFMVVDPRLIAPKPRSIDFAEAAALPLVAITAWEALVDKLVVHPGQTVLVHAGTGGVGHVAIQIAKSRGAKVVATVSGLEKAELAKALGADETVNYRTQSVEQYVTELTGGRGFEVVFDTLGGENLDRSLAAAAPYGAVATILAESTHDLSPLHLKSLSLHGVLMLLPMLLGQGRKHHGEILREVASLVDQGRLRPLLDSERFTLRELGAAHARLESGKAIGKVVVSV
jgi:NADPH2:quinone reductase